MNRLNKLTKKPFLILLFFSIISLIYLFYSTKNGSIIQKAPFILPSPTPISNIKSRQTLFQKIKTYEINFDNNFDFSFFPQTLNVYSTSVTSEDLNLLAQKFVTNYSLTQLSNSNNLWQSRDKSYNLDINYERQYFTFTQNFKNSLYTRRYDLTQAENTSKNILSKYFLNQKLILLSDKTRYTSAVKGQTEWSLTTPENANLIGLSFGIKIDNYPYYYNNNIHPNLSITLGPNNTLYNLFYISQPKPELSNPVSKKILNPTQIKQLLEDGQGEILSVNLMTLPPNSTSLPLLTITKTEIEYRYSPDKKMLIPFFRFTAIYDNSEQSKDFPVTLILPAVEI